MKPFRFQKFAINQRPEVFRVGTDGVLLGALANAENASDVLEVGTGTGLISLMIAQRNANAKISAIDLNNYAADLARENFENSPFRNRLSVYNEDFKNFNPQKKFDLIISNPPFFEENPSVKDIQARQQKELTFKNLIEKSSELLNENGIFSVIIPFSAVTKFKNTASHHGLYLQRTVTVYGSGNSAPKRAILEFTFNESSTSIEEKFVIESAPRVYSQQYLEATKAFHVFG